MIAEEASRGAGHAPDRRGSPRPQVPLHVTNNRVALAAIARGALWVNPYWKAMSQTASESASQYRTMSYAEQMQYAGQVIVFLACDHSAHARRSLIPRN